jgi:hypothetical protein
MALLILLFGVFLIGSLLGFIVRSIAIAGGQSYPYPRDFVVTRKTSGTSAVSGGTQTSNISKTHRRNMLPENGEFWRVFQGAAKKGKPLRSEMNRRKPEDRIDFEKIQSNGFVVYEYLIDGTIADVEAVKLHVGCTN